MWLRVHGLRKRFGRCIALDGFSFDAGVECKCLGLLGRNGAGKTTFLRILVGLLEPDAGRVEVAVMGGTYDRVGPRLGTFLAERAVLVGSLTGSQHMELYSAMNELIGVPTDLEKLGALIDRLELRDELCKRIDTMSKGTRRKIEVAAAIAADIPLVIADELTDGLDVPSRLVVEECIHAYCSEGKRFIVSSHDLSFISAVCDSVVIVDRGRCADAFVIGRDGASFKPRVAAAFSRD